MPLCERCGCEHDGTYGSGRYCSSYCAHNTVGKMVPVAYHDGEIWKCIVDFNDYYVSNLGNIAICVKNKLYRVNDSDLKGYRKVILIKDGKKVSKQVHRLVLAAFCPVCNAEELEVNHKNENKADNRLENLEWCNRLYNVNYGTAIQRMKDKQSVPVMCTTTGVIYKSLTDASKQTGVHLSCVSRCCNGKIKSVKGLEFRFV